MSLRTPSLLRVAVAAALAIGAERTASAHEPFEITTDARVHADRLDLKIILAGSTATKSCPGASGHKGELGRAQFEALRPRFEACARELFAITGGGEAMLPLTTRVALTEEQDVEVTLVYPPPPKSPLRFDAAFLRRLPDPTYGAVLTVTGEGTFLGQQLLRADASTLDIDLAPPPAPPAKADEPPASPPATPEAKAPAVAKMPTFGQYLRLGVEHILRGYDHLLFLAGLLVTLRRLRPVLGAVTCFTLAHSITLALAALDVFTIPSRLAEPLIAATIVFVAAENVLRGGEPRRRSALAFAFGLIHGFGFASVLRGLGLGAPGAPLVGPLLAFNLGVEIGQIAVGSVFLAILWRARSVPVLARYGPKALSVVIGSFGLYWFLLRAVLGGAGPA